MDVIYKLTSPNNKVYIGRTNNFERRLIEHKFNAYTDKLPNSLYRAIRKYGWDNFKKEVICEVKPDTAQKLEEELILAHNSVRKGYNDTFIGAGGDNWKGKRDTKEYFEYIAKMREMNKGEKNGMYGKSHKKSTIKSMKEKAKGRFSLPWFQDRYGIDEGTKKYQERCQWLRERNLAKNNKGRFVKSK